MTVLCFQWFAPIDTSQMKPSLGSVSKGGLGFTGATGAALPLASVVQLRLSQPRRRVIQTGLDISFVYSVLWRRR
jgi:hypothetical protein